MKRILHISNKPIYPLVDGGCVAMHQFCQSLFKIEDTEIFHLCISTPKHAYSAKEYERNAVQFKAYDNVHVDTSIRLKDGISTALKGKSYNLSRFKSEALVHKIESWIVQHSIDILLFDSLYSAAILEENHFSIPCYIRSHNIESDLWLQKAQQAGWKAPLLRFMAKSLAKQEFELLKKVDGVLFISKDDKKQLEKKNIHVHSTVIPVGLQTIENETRFHSNRFHFIGAMNWFPNQEAMEILLSDVFPIIRAENPDAELHLAGSYFPSNITTDTDKGIIIHGFVNDATSFRRSHGVQLMPIQTGSGVRIKLIEALSEGIPVVATPTAVFGMDEGIEDCCKIEKNSRELAKAALELNENSEIRHRLTQNGRNFVEKHFSIESIAQKIAKFILT